MAFLVCFSRSPPHDHCRDTAIYLDQQFYELIYSRCRNDEETYVVLREIALLKYKSPTMIVAGDTLDLLEQELAVLNASGRSHSQISELRRVCSTARTNGVALTISGDMYPELWKQEA